MTQLSESDRQEMQMLAAQALVSDEPATMEAAALDVDDIKDFFCKNWPMIKKVLEFIAENVGGIVRAAIRAVIAAGDFLYRRICSG